MLLILLPPEFRAFFTIFLIILVLEMDAFVSFLFCLFIVRERPISFVFYQLFKNIDFVRSQNFRKFSIFFSKIVSLIKRFFGFKHDLFSQVCYEKTIVFKFVRTKDLEIQIIWPFLICYIGRPYTTSCRM